jgi:pilus assembly protein Flp/PilA
MHILGSVPAGFLKEQRGAALMEYALLLALISIVCILAITTLGSESAEKFSTVGNSIGAAGG